MEIREGNDYPREGDDLRIGIREHRLTPEEIDRLYREVEKGILKPDEDLYRRSFKGEKIIQGNRSEPDPNEVYRLYHEEGLSQKNVAKELGVTEWAVRKVFRRFGLETRSIEGVHSDIDHNEVCQRFFGDGWSQKRIAEATGLTEWEVRRILSRPRVEALEDPALATLSDRSEMVELSRAQYDEAIRRNPELRLMRSFDKKHLDVHAYFDLKDLLAEGEIDPVEFARERGIYYGKVAKWAQKAKQPTLLITAFDCELRRSYKETHGSLPSVEPDVVHEDRVEYEQRRIIREWAKTADVENLLQPETYEYSPELLKSRPALTRISVSEVEDILGAYDSPIETLAELVEYAFEHSSRVSCLDLSEVESWKLRALRETFLSVPEAVEWTVMEKAAGSPFRVGLVVDTLYVWKPDSSFFNLMNIYNDFFFYFSDRNEIAQFISEVSSSLSDDRIGLRETVDHLEELILQMLPGTGKVNLINDKGSDYRILGKHLHLLLDLAGLSPSKLEGRISKLTNCASGQGGIKNPRFLEGEELEIALARLAATILCDGHIARRNGAVSYHESNLDRIRIVKTNLRGFGDVDLLGYWDKGVYNCYISTVFGSVLQHLGLSAGDKTVQNPELKPEFIEGLSRKALCAFIEDTLPEDGTVAPYRISCTHSMALHAGDKTTVYGMTPLIGAPEIELIKAEGTRVDDGIINSWSLPFGKITSQMDSLNPEIAAAANKLHTVIMANPSNFILAEQRALEKLGIEAERKPVTVSYHIKSNRVSVSWIWIVTGDNAIKLAILAPSNDIINRGKLGNWLRRIPIDVKRIIANLKQEGIESHQWWN